MKKVLIIAYYFNQTELIGSVRLRGLAKYLPKFGWDPIILTIKSGSNESETSFKTVETEYSDLITNWKSRIGLNSESTVKDQLKNEKDYNKLMDFLINIWGEVIAYPDPQKNWYKPAVEAGNELLETEDFDAILSSSFPVTSHLIAYELKKRYQIPWMADLRDLWSQNHYYKFSKLRKLRETQLEKKTLSKADALSTVSVPWVNNLKELHKNKKVFSIPNGFDPEKTWKVPLDEKFNIIYTGNIYAGKMDPEPLFKALNELTKSKEIDSTNLLVEFYGTKRELLLKSIEKYHFEKIVKIHNTIPHEEVLKKQNGAQLLLLLDWNDPCEKGVLPAKIFEYLAAKRPIISIGGHGGAVKELIKKTNAGLCPNNFEELKCIIKNAYSEFELYNEVKYNGISEEINKYNQLEMTKKFVKVLNEL